MTNEKRLEKTLAKAYSKGWEKEIFDSANKLILSGVDRYTAFDSAYCELKNKHEKNLPSDTVHGDAGEQL
jgi:hypothetical protein